MNCACVAVDIDDYVDLISKTKPVARTEHACHECRRRIRPGEQYEVQKYVFEGTFETHKTCSECVEIRDMFFCDGYHYGQTRDDLNDDLIDADCELPESCIAALSPKVQDIVCGVIEECWETKIAIEDFGG